MTRIAIVLTAILLATPLAARDAGSFCPAPMESQLAAVEALRTEYEAQVKRSEYWRTHPRPWDRERARAEALGFGFSQELAVMQEHPAIQPCVWMAIVRLEWTFRDMFPIPALASFRSALNGEWDWRLIQTYELEPSGPFFLDLIEN